MIRVRFGIPMDILPQLILNSLIVGSLYAILALGFNLIYSTAKFFDFGYGALAAVGGYGVFFLLKKVGLPLPVGVIGGILLAGLVSYLLYRLVYAPLRARKASQTVLLVAALGVFTAVQAVIAILFTSQFQTLAGNTGVGRLFQIGNGVVTGTQLVMFGCALGLTALLWLLLRKTMFGKAITAISDDEEVSKIVGINTGKVLGGVFFLTGCIAGLAGILAGFDTGIEPIMGLPLLLAGIVSAIVGGIGNVFGGIAGGFLLAFVENFGIWKLAGEWKSAIAFGLLILFLLFRPEGIFKK